VLVSVAGESMTDADLDRMVEQRVDQQLRMAGAEGDEATRRMLLKRFSDPSIRQQLLTDLLRRELFTRRARELGIDQTDDFVRQRQMLEDDLLASSFEQQKLSAIQPTRVDLESYFSANQDQYIEPESVEVVFLELQPDEEAKDLLKEIESADAFRELAASRQKADGDESEELQTTTLTRGRKHPELGDVDTLLDLEPGAWTNEPYVNGQRRFLVFVEDKTPARTPEFDEVASRVEAEYRRRKQQEILEKTFQELMTRYEVEIKPQTPEGGPPAASEGNDQHDD
jgi:hypothetical protein